jgi:hypothetical protein
MLNKHLTESMYLVVQALNKHNIYTNRLLFNQIA